LVDVGGSNVGLAETPKLGTEVVNADQQDVGTITSGDNARNHRGQQKSNRFENRPHVNLAADG
jgi:hypothetical protein